METQSKVDASWRHVLRRSAGKLAAGSFLFFLAKGLVWLALVLPFVR